MQGWAWSKCLVKSRKETAYQLAGIKNIEVKYPVFFKAMWSVHTVKSIHQAINSMHKAPWRKETSWRNCYFFFSWVKWHPICQGSSCMQVTGSASSILLNTDQGNSDSVTMWSIVTLMRLPTIVPCRRVGLPNLQVWDSISLLSLRWMHAHICISITFPF